MNVPQQRSQVTSLLVTLAHNANVSIVALYGEMLSEQEKRLQQLAAQLGMAQQECAKLAAACTTKDAQIRALEENQVRLMKVSKEPKQR